MKRILFIPFFIIIPALIAFTDNTRDVSLRVQSRYNSIRDFKSRFSQEVRYTSFGKSEVDEGLFFYKKPNKMRWEYAKPKEQLIVIDGENIWFYFPQDRQVITGKIEQTFSSDVPTSFLAGMGNLTESFSISPAKLKCGEKSRCPENKKLKYLKLVPKQAIEGISDIVIGVDEENGFVYESILTDKMKNETIISFSDINVNINLPDDLFTFTIPKGVEVIKSPKKKP